MNEKHTPGPWHVVRYGDGDSLVICNDPAGNSRVAFMAVPGGRCLGDRRAAWARIKAEARLIAAAPELLEALEYLVSLGGGDCLNMARAAIAKARGQS